MKYIWILIALILLVRIDMVLRFFDKTWAKYQTKSNSVQINEVESTLEVRPLADDPNLKATPKKIFLTMLEAFHNNPDNEVRKMALEELRKNPLLFSEKLDPQLEEEIYRWRNTLNNKTPQAIAFLLELMNALKGENQEMVKRFFSLYIDIDLAGFLSVYSKTKDTNCLIITYLGDNISEAENYNELVERLNSLNVFIAEENPDPLKAYALSCQMVLKLHLEAIQGKQTPPVPEEPAPPITTPAPAPEGATP